MLQYLYTLDYSTEHLSDCMYEKGEDGLLGGSNKPLGQGPCPQLVFDISVYRMGDKYGIHGLKGMASEKFADTLKRYAKQPFSSISVPALATVIKSTYESTPDSDKGLRNHVLEFAKRHLKHLLALEEFKMVLAEIPEFSYQLLQQAAKVSVEVTPSKRKR